jgi:hypothetical protein
MPVATIPTLRPNVTRNEAIHQFSAKGLARLFWTLRSGSLQRIADVYVPFWTYRARCQMNRAVQERIFALDAVNGSLDLFSLPGVPSPGELQPVTTRNFLVPGLSETQAASIVREKVLRAVFLQGFFKLRGASVEIRREAGEIYMPYWLGFYGGRGAVRCRVLDAVRRRVEGAKASAFFEEWLAA